MNASNDKRTPAILVVALCLTAMDAQACGDLMLRTVSTMRYHAFVTRHPAAILLYSGEAVPKDSSATGTKLHNSLEKAGHKVTLVRSPDELAQALAAHPFDVIIAYAVDMDNVTSQLAKGSREPTLIPVLGPGAANERQMRERFPRLVSKDTSLNDLLKAIEESMKAPRT